MLGFIILNSTIFIREFIIAHKRNKQDVFIEKLDSALFTYTQKLENTYPLGFFIKLKSVVTSVDQITEYNNIVVKNKFNSAKKDTLKDDEIYVLVLGESARKHNFSLYGYHRNTNPLLARQKNLIKFDDVKTSAGFTHLSVPMILSRTTPQNNTQKFSEPTLVNAFKEASFKTYWLSNQDYKSSSIFKLYAQQVDYYKNTAVSIDVPTYDEILAKEFTTVLNDTTSKKKFIILHLIGNHYRYNLRYPKAFQKFNPITSNKVLFSNNEKNLKEPFTNSYDNSILYTDYVLNLFIDALKKTKKISYLFYISDHGENLYDTNEHLFLHGQLNPTKYELNIPLFIWLSKQYQEEYPIKTTILKENKSKKIASTNSFHTILDLSNITYPTEKLFKSFANKKFDSLQKRYFYRIDKTILKLD
ncbi:MAG: phosphoethanolamine transferase [Flavobacteriaceae bacterium]|nr:phosphoethanolamine transferase [Flavobacteriaceae bacterium]